MEIKVIVFDFDGTLVDSNRLKYDTFFDLFPSDDFHNRVINDVLTKLGEESRYIIISEILNRIESSNNGSLSSKKLTEDLVNKYGARVMAGLRNCNEKPRAGKILKQLSAKYPLYLSSTTPEADLRKIVKYKRWGNIFCDIFGYPNKKTSTLFKIIKRESIVPNNVLVVGDGESDKVSAFTAGCKFYHINKDGLLDDLNKYL